MANSIDNDISRLVVGLIVVLAGGSRTAPYDLIEIVRVWSYVLVDGGICDASHSRQLKQINMQMVGRFA